MELRNKTVVFLGDSITEGVGTSSPEKSYVSIFQKLSGAKVINYGISGTRIAKNRSPSACPEWDQDFISRVDKMQRNADVIVVFGGTNDFGHGDSGIGDFESKSEYTFYGALHILCSRLIEKYPYAEIVFVTPLHRISENNPINEIGRKVSLLSEYVAAIQQVASYYGFPVLDLFHTSGLQPKVEIIQKLYMPDGLHPSDKGAERIAHRLYAFLNTLA